MKYSPHTENDINLMLKTIGLNNLEELFQNLPEQIKNIPKDDPIKGMTELEIKKHFIELANQNKSFSQYPVFLGGGVYDHFIPSAVDALSSRGEFATAYTPYQAEASQGELQAIMEYQTAISRLTSMDISNASLYDGSSALAEAILMAVELTGRKKVLLSSTIHPEWLEVVNTYIYGQDIQITFIDQSEGETDFQDMANKLSPEIACVCIQSPNFYGIIENYKEIKNTLLKNNILLVVATYPFSLGFLESPGNMGADIVVGDGQSIGNYVSFGGPHFGFLSCKEEYIRKLPGRIVGITSDHSQHMGFCLTFQTREQHIRREKATSNICSNHALMALRSIIYLSLLGDEGLKEAASLCYHKAHYLQKKINELNSFKLKYNKPFFNEFLIETRIDANIINKSLFNEGFIGGLCLSRFDESKSNQLLIAVTEKRTKNEMDRFVKVLQKFN